MLINPRRSEELESRKNKLNTYIKTKENAEKLSTALKNIKSSPEAKLSKLSNVYKNGLPVAIDAILGTLYKDSLPYDDPMKNISDADAAKMVNDFINWRTDGKDSEYYIREALKKTESATLEGVLECAKSLLKSYYTETAEKLGKINIEDINFNPNNTDDELEKINKKLEFDDIASIIQNNVQDTIQREIEKSQREKEAMDKLEDDLSNDETIVDEATLDKAIARANVNKPKIYQPSLFESVFMNKINKKDESKTEEDAFNEAVEDYTMFSMAKALKLESFDKYSVKKIADSYNRMAI